MAFLQYNMTTRVVGMGLAVTDKTIERYKGIGCDGLDCEDRGVRDVRARAHDQRRPGNARGQDRVKHARRMPHVRAC